MSQPWARALVSGFVGLAMPMVVACSLVSTDGLTGGMAPSGPDSQGDVVGLAETMADADSGVVLGMDAGASGDAVADSRVDQSMPLPDSGAKDSTTGADGGPTGPAPIEFVQATANSSSDGSPTVTTTFATPAVAHHTIVLVVVFDAPDAGPGTVTLTDNVGTNTYQALVGPLTGNGDTEAIVGVLDVAAGTTSFTASVANAPRTFFDLFIQEFSGIASFDDGDGQNGTTAAMSSGPFTLHQSREMIFGFGKVDEATPGVGFTQISNFHGNLGEMMILSDAGVGTISAATGTMTGGASWTMFGAAFRGQ